MSKSESTSKGRRVRDEADARALLAAISASSQRLKPWCQSNGVNPHSLYWWRSKLGRQRHGGRRHPRLQRALEAVPVAEVKLALPPRAPRYELALPNGLTLRVDSGFEAEAVERLLAVALRC